MKKLILSFAIIVALIQANAQSTTLPQKPFIAFRAHADPNTSGTIFKPNKPHDSAYVYRSIIDNSMWEYNVRDGYTKISAADLFRHFYAHNYYIGHTGQGDSMQFPYVIDSGRIIGSNLYLYRSDTIFVSAVPAVFNAKNGLTKRSDTVLLGGPLTEPTNIGTTGTARDLTLRTRNNIYNSKHFYVSGTGNSGLIADSAGATIKGVNQAGTGVLIDGSTAASSESDVGGHGVLMRGNSGKGGNDVVIQAYGTNHIILMWADSGKVVPLSDSSTDLGDATHRWKDLYVSGSSIWLGASHLTDSNFVSGASPVVSPSGKMVYNFTAPRWVKVTKTYSDFSTAGLTNDISIYTLPAKGYISDIKIVPSTAFSGGTIATYTISVGISGSLAKYAIATNTFTGNSTLNAVHTPLIGMESVGSTTDIRAQAISTIGLLNAATAGSVDIYLLISILP